MDTPKHNIDLSNKNSFGVRAIAKSYFEFSDCAQLKELFECDPYKNMPFKVLGAGNNIVMSQTITDLIIKPISKQISLLPDGSVYAAAGVDWDEFVLWSVENSLWGLENLSLIPGTVGAAPVQNIGAYGVEVGDSIISVDVFYPKTLQTETITKQECRFGYRDSIFKNQLKGQVIITGVRFALHTTANPKLEYSGLSQTSPIQSKIREKVIELRQGKLPDTKVLGNAGSFFKNPIIDLSKAQALKEIFNDLPIYPSTEPLKVKIAAAYLIEKAGWKGYRKDHVGVHSTQALVLVNFGGATGDEIINLAKDIIQDIQNKFQITIEMEVNLW